MPTLPLLRYIKIVPIGDKLYGNELRKSCPIWTLIG